MSTTWSSKPEILRCTKKTTAICPLTQWYCWSGCALAISVKDSWTCGLNTNAPRFVEYVDGKDND